MSDETYIGKKRWIPELDDYYKVVDFKTGTIEFITNHPTFATLKNAFLAVGIDILTIKTEEELDHFESTYEEHINSMILSKYRTMKPKTLSQQLAKARLLGNNEEADRIREKLRKQKQLDLHITKETKR